MSERAVQRVLAGQAPLSSLKGRRPRSFRSIDRLRLMRFKELRDEGKQPLQAWTEVATDPQLGTRDWRGKTAISATAATAGLAKFLERVEPNAVAEARAAARVECAMLSSKMVHVLRDVAEGNFGEGKVTIRGEEETVTVDATAARVRMEAASKILMLGGSMPRAQEGAMGTQGTTAVQVNVGPSAHELAQALAQDPQAHAAAIDAARRVNGNVPEVRGSRNVYAPAEDPADVGKPPIRYTDPDNDPWDDELPPRPE